MKSTKSIQFTKRSLPVKKITFAVFVFAALFALTHSHKAYADSSQIIGHESHEVSWHGMPASDHGDKYQLYYGQKKGGPYEHSVKIPGTGTSAVIGSLKSGETYYYRVAAEVGGQLHWYSEKMLQTTSGEKPVLGVRTGGDALAMTRMRTCSATGHANVSIRAPGGVTVAKVHVYFGGSNNYMHALRDLEPTVREVRIGSLDTCSTYYYQVAIVGNDGRVHWQGEKMLSVMP